VSESGHIVCLEDAEGVDEAPGVHDHEMAKGSCVPVSLVALIHFGEA
jgi:hypothetical protein